MVKEQQDKYFNRHSNFYVLRKLVWLHTKTFFRMPWNIFVGLFVMYLILVMWLIFKPDNVFVIPSIVAVSITRNTVSNLYRVLFRYKFTSIDKRIMYLPTSIYTNFIAVCLFSFIFNFINSAILMSVPIIFQSQITVHSTNWLMYLSGSLLLWITCVLTLYIIFFWMGIKYTQLAQGIVIVLYVVVFNLMGCAFPYDLIMQHKGLNAFLYLFPQRYAINIMQAGWINATDMIMPANITTSNLPAVSFGFAGQLWIPYLVSIVYIILMVGMLYIFFIFKSEAQFHVYTKAQKQNKESYLYRVKHAESIEKLNQIHDEWNNSHK
ncbi:hypothetical protein [Spiroplasma endosymbiont of Crioceris asparagi]|uniref:hypothetical protein n=1 Tax=Spiroplasma endosymbiont of Crioceris asparagi TaxID=3066286 RepID=UPI0030D24990